jgi:hypothetical protein
MARQFIRQLGIVPFSQSNVQRLELPRNHVFKALELELTGSVTIAGGAANGIAHDSQPMSLIRSIRIVRNGSEVLQDLTGPEAFAIATINWGAPASFLAVAGGGAVGGPTAFSANLRIDFAALGLSTPSLTLLKAVGASSLFIEVTWGALSNLFVGNDRTGTFTNCQLRVMGIEIMDVAGRFGDKILRPIDRVVAASASDLEIQLQTGPLYKRVFFRTSQSTDGDEYDTLINNLRLSVDGVLYLADRVTWNQLRAHNKRIYGLETIPSGYGALDFCEDGNGAGMIATAGAAEVKFLFDVTAGAATCNLRIIPEMFVPPPQGLGQ